MRFGTLRAVAHNLAHSLASGASLLAGCYGHDVFGEVARSPGGSIEVDLLTGQVMAGTASAQLRSAIEACHLALPDLCARHRLPVEVFRCLRLRFFQAERELAFEVTIADAAGRTATDLYRGKAGARPRRLDAIGRVRR